MRIQEAQRAAEGAVTGRRDRELLEREIADRAQANYDRLLVGRPTQVDWTRVEQVYGGSPTLTISTLDHSHTRDVGSPSFGVSAFRP